MFLAYREFRSPSKLASVMCCAALIASGVLTTIGCLPRDEEVGRSRPTKEGAGASGSTTPNSSNKPKPASSAAVPPPPARPDPILTAEFADDFERPNLGPAWRATSGQWRISEGKLCGANARNHPVWLRRRLPTNAIIEFDAISYSPDGDLKAEFWGDGRSGATGNAYTNATSYLTIWGGWKNTYHVLARINEHGEDRKELTLRAGSEDLRTAPVTPEKTYRFRVERSDGRTVQWSVDGKGILNFPDNEPLTGAGHEHFGYNDWDVRVCFDNLKITPLP
jgi:hypothetical protein